MRKLSDSISWKLHPPHSMEMNQISGISMYKRNPWKFHPLIQPPTGGPVISLEATDLAIASQNALH